MTNDYRIRFGAVGWQHPQWQNDFYPDDLPQDWLLAFYGNEFPVVAVPAAAWSDVPATQMEEWQDNSDEHFRFIFEWPWTTAEDLREFSQRIAAMQSQSLGILLQLPWSACCASTGLLEIVNEIAADTAVCLEIMNDDMQQAKMDIDFSQHEIKALLAIPQVSCCWHAVEAHHELFFDDPKLAVTKITDTAITPQQVRHLLEVCSAQVQSHDDTVVLFSGQPPGLQAIRDAMVMLELLA